MCEHCDGVEGKPMLSDSNFEAVIEPYHGRLRVDHGCETCGLWSCRYVQINFCPMCGRDLREAGLGGD